MVNDVTDQSTPSSRKRLAYAIAIPFTLLLAELNFISTQSYIRAGLHLPFLSLSEQIISNRLARYS